MENIVEFIEQGKMKPETEKSRRHRESAHEKTIHICETPLATVE